MAANRTTADPRTCALRQQYDSNVRAERLRAKSFVLGRLRAPSMQRFVRRIGTLPRRSSAKQWAWQLRVEWRLRIHGALQYSLPGSLSRGLAVLFVSR